MASCTLVVGIKVFDLNETLCLLMLFQFWIAAVFSLY